MDGKVTMDLSYPGSQPLGYYAPPGAVVTLEVGQDLIKEAEGELFCSKRRYWIADKRNHICREHFMVKL